MLATIIKKEILEALISLRFLIATLLCLVLIPLGMYVNLKEYEQQLADYQEAVRLYQQRIEGNIDFDLQAEGYRPPSLLSIFSVGLEYFLPNKIVTSRDGNFRMSNEAGVNNPQSLLFGKIDLLFNVSFVISLLVLIFTFNAISGEKEEGTIRLIMSNPVPRWQILLGKLIGNYTVLMIPFILSLLISLIILSISGYFPVFSSRILLPFLAVLFITLLFILSIFNLSIFISSLTHRSSTSLVIALFAWTVFVLSLPKISPMIAEILYPVESQQVLNLRKTLTRENILKELDKERRDLYERVLTDFGLSFQGAIALGTKGPLSPEQRKFFGLSSEEADKLFRANAKYGELVKPMEQKYNERVSMETKKLENDYIHRRNIQAAIAMNLSRISPVSCYSYVVAEIAGTGVTETNNFQRNADRFQNEVKENIYDKFIIYRYARASGSEAWDMDYAEGFDPKAASVPHLNYQQIPLSAALQAERMDILLLFLFNVLFFAASYVSFLRYDVR
ncbi:MAG: ABC transporter permease [candidate division KSB1 bacterium]|nr:ABC transporter permease [candidate division KSB1 bacterium]MDZ7304904.1 ABC transporter permease [candidate division KSB1 bacterium]MDZ7313960.1 ABC transporter permease [candidate division KSB1 bacterium]